MNIFYYDTPLGTITLGEKDSKICRLSFGQISIEGAEVRESDIIKKAYSQLCEYFEGERKLFDLPLLIEGSEFQKKVLNALLKVPYGTTASYKELAIAAGNEKASRAVGMANNRNHIAIIIPCHRIIGSNGKLVGYAAGLEIKEKLLTLETLN